MAAATAILRSQDVLRNRNFRETLTIPSPSSKFNRSTNPNPNPSAAAAASKSRRRKRSPVKANDRARDQQQALVARSSAAKDLVMGQVKILKRGEPLVTAKNKENDFDSAVLGKKENDFDSTVSGKKGNNGFNLAVLRKKENNSFDSAEPSSPKADTVKKKITVGVLDGVYAGSGMFTSPPPSSVPVPGFLCRNGAATSDLRRMLGLDIA